MFIKKYISIILAILLSMSLIFESVGVYAASKVAPTYFTSASAKTNSAMLYWKKKSGISGYQIQYSTDKKFKKNAKKVVVKKSKTVSKKITGLKSSKKYYFRIRTFKGKKYSTWSKVKSISTKSGKITKNDLLNYYWQNNIQSPKVYEFLPDNTGIEYDAFPDDPKSAWSYVRKFKYNFKNDVLTMTFSSKYDNKTYTYKLKCVKINYNIKFDWGFI